MGDVVLWVLWYIRMLGNMILVQTALSHVPLPRWSQMRGGSPQATCPLPPLLLPPSCGKCPGGPIISIPMCLPECQVPSIPEHTQVKSHSAREPGNQAQGVLECVSLCWAMLCFPALSCLALLCTLLLCVPKLGHGTFPLQLAAVHFPFILRTHRSTLSTFSLNTRWGHMTQSNLWICARLDFPG